MSTSPQYTLKSHDVYHLTIDTLDALPLTMPGAIGSRDLMRVLAFAAASNRSVHHTCDELEGAPSAPTVLGTLADQLADLDALEDQLNELLARLIPKGLGKRPRRVAIDLIALPYHGTVAPAYQGEVCRSKAKSGTPGGPTGTYALAPEKQGRWTSYTLRSTPDGHVEFDLAIVCHNTRGQRGKHQREALLYAMWGVKHRPLSWIRSTYRGRFGIESSYRQVHQARI